MYTYYTKEFSSSLIEGIGDWINSFYDKTKTNSEQSVEIITYTPIHQRISNVSGLKSILVTIKVFKAV